MRMIHKRYNAFKTGSKMQTDAIEVHARGTVETPEAYRKRKHLCLDCGNSLATDEPVVCRECSECI